MARIAQVAEKARVIVSRGLRLSIREGDTMPTIRERIANTRHLDTFAVDLPDITGTKWQPRYVKARNFKVTREGALIFYTWPWVKVAAFPPGTWPGGVARGVEPEGDE